MENRWLWKPEGTTVMFTSQVDYICAAEQNAFILVGYTVYKTKDDLSGFTALTGSLPSSGKNNCFVHKGILYAHVGFSPQYLSRLYCVFIFFTENELLQVLLFLDPEDLCSVCLLCKRIPCASLLTEAVIFSTLPLVIVITFIMNSSL